MSLVKLGEALLSGISNGQFFVMTSATLVHFSTVHYDGHTFQEQALDMACLSPLC